MLWVYLTIIVVELALLILLALPRRRGASSFRIRQVIGGKLMPITGIVVGATGGFSETPAPPGSSLQTGNIPVWTADDTTISLVPAADGTSVTATVPTGHASGVSFGLTCSGVSSDGTAISTTVAVPVLPPPVVPATGFDINQTS